MSARNIPLRAALVEGSVEYHQMREKLNKALYDLNMKMGEGPFPFTSVERGEVRTAICDGLEIFNENCTLRELWNYAYKALPDNHVGRALLLGLSNK